LNGDRAPQLKAIVGLLLNLMESKKSADAAIDRFAEVARRYCAWVERELSEPNDEMRRVRLCLAELHLAAVELPALGIGENIDAVSISHDEWSRFYEKFGGLPVTNYSDVFNPLKEEKPVVNSLADDLADIYRDLKAGLSIFEANHPIDAAWEWRFGFQTHWGHHLVGAQRAIHEYLAEEDL
jgi:hypothetical protein